MKKFIAFLGRLNDIIRTFPKKEYWGFLGLVAVAGLSVLVIAVKVNNLVSLETPVVGGQITEGIIGTPRFINPILAISDADRDLTALVYSGLMRKTPDGQVTPDLAERYEISDDGLSYTFFIRKEAVFHDHKPVTADDIIFTITTAQNTMLKSPRKTNWEGVEVEKLDERTVKFTLKQPYASFLENTVMCILPAYKWKELSIDEFSFSDLNTNGIGSGPYRIKKISKKSSGIPAYYELEPFKQFVFGKPHIKEIIIYFYPNEKELLAALDRGDINQAPAISPENAADFKNGSHRISSAVLPRVFGLFFNQSQASVFTDKSVIKAIDLAVDKNRIIKEVLSGYGVSVNGPLPIGFGESVVLSGTENTVPETAVDEAKEVLNKAGWKPGKDGILEKQIKDTKGKKSTTRLQFSISTGDTPELQKTAEIIKENLLALGMAIEIKTFELGTLNQEVIYPREYDALLFGQIIGQGTDLFVFWHSSQRNAPGLNIAMYTSSKTDKILEEIIKTTDPELRRQKYRAFEEEVRKDAPAVFIYSPEFIYVVSKNLKGLNLNNLTLPSDRFLEIHKWYVETEKIWKIFQKND